MKTFFMSTRGEGTSKPDIKPRTPHHAPAIRLVDLSLRYGEKCIFSAISTAIQTGKITALVGPSGCGKTSFLMSLNRLTDLIPGCKISGKILINDSDICDRRVDVVALRRHVGMIFQKPNPFPLSIRRNIEFPLRENGVTDSPEIVRIIEAALKDVGLWDEVKDRLDTSALALSGGHQQRLCIARTLALKPQILLMDEPCSSLDPIASGIVEDLIVSLRNHYTVLIVTHNLAQARRIADEVMVFWTEDDCCRLVEQGPVKQIFESPQDAITAAYVSGMRG